MIVMGAMLNRLMVQGELVVIDAKGKVHSYGPGGGDKVTIRFHDTGVPRRMTVAPSMAMGEGYMDGRLTVEDGGTIYDFLALVTSNVEKAGYPAGYAFFSALGRLVRRFHQYNPAGRAKKNVAHHYDLSGELYDLFLDKDKQYSCAYFADPDDDIDTAQANKKRHIAAKLLLGDGQRVLDIGSGWGGMGLYLAQESLAHVIGITLSEEQIKVSNERARAMGLAERAEFHLRDYRSETGTYDRIVSVGMFEHVGVGYYRAFFNKVADLLADDGVALLHTIGRSGGPSSTDPWIRKYIFPGGYIPALSEVMPAVENAQLVTTDIEFLGPHYAETLRHWRERFMGQWDKVAGIYDERFCRMWEFYLAASETAFRYMGMTVFQLQLAKRRSAVPMTRDYMHEWEAAHPLPLPRDEAA